MKRNVLFWLMTFFVFSTPLSAFVADSFDAPRTEHITKRGDFVGGSKKGARVPFVISKPAQDAERGKVFEISYNVSEGFGGTFVVFRPKRIPADFNIVRFWVRGSPSAFKVELKDEAIHSFVIEKSERTKWKEVAIPVASFSNSETLHKDQIKEFVFVFEDYRTSPRLGTIFIDDLEFVTDAGASDARARRASPLLTPGPVLVNGDLPAGRIFIARETKLLKLSCKVPRKAKFAKFRLEASLDEALWFYLDEFENTGKQFEFEHGWKVTSFPSGTYWVRGVILDEAGQRREGQPTKVTVQNHFDFDGFLDEVERKTFDYFVNEVDERYFLVKDRDKNGSHLSTGLSGFQWTSYVIGTKRGWMKKEEALKRMNASMDFFLGRLNRYNGLLPHWLGPDLREIWEVGMGDAVETSYVLAGALTASQFFNGSNPLEAAFREKTNRLYREVNWAALLERRNKKDQVGLLPWHWSAESGASKLELQGYNEAMIVYLLALGAPENAISKESWDAWAKTYQKGKYGAYELIACAPLFTHQYSHLWVDFKTRRDRYANYFENSILATLANREFSLKENHYEPEIWGLTASEGPNSYKAYGAPPMASAVPVLNDGTIAPTAAATSIMFTPALSMAAMKDMRERFEGKVWGRYGFKDAFNPKTNWAYDGYLGLDQGPILIAIENYRSGLIWRLFMQNPYIQKGLERAGFREEIAEVGSRK